MNNYPDGFMPRVEHKTVDIVCPTCGYAWEMVVLTELGYRWYVDEDFGNICPECGEEGEEK